MKKNVIGAICLQGCFFLLPFSGLHASNPVDSAFSRNIISVNLASPFDPSFPRFRIGYTRLFASKWSVSTDMGYGKYGILPDSAFYTNRPLLNDYRLWEIRSETRFYFAETRKYFTPYAAVEIYYIHHTQTMHNDTYMPLHDSIAVHYSQADYLRQKYGFNLKAGIIIKFSSHIAAEFYGGGGIRARKNSFSNVVYPSSGGTPWFSDLNYYFFEGTRWNLNITFGLKFDIVF